MLSILDSKQLMTDIWAPSCPAQKSAVYIKIPDNQHEIDNIGGLLIESGEIWGLRKLSSNMYCIGIIS